MAKRRTTQKLAELKQLAQQAKENTYQRIQLASEVLEDLDWIAATHGGSIDLARETLQAEYFHDLDGFVSLSTLISMFKKVPKEEWDACHHKIAAIKIIFEGDYKDEKAPSTPRHDWKKDHDVLLDKYEDLEKDLDSWKGIASDRDDKIQELQAEVTELKAGIARLEGRLEELRRRSAA